MPADISLGDFGASPLRRLAGIFRFVNKSRRRPSRTEDQSEADTQIGSGLENLTKRNFPQALYPKHHRDRTAGGYV